MFSITAEADTEQGSEGLVRVRVAQIAKPSSTDITGYLTAAEAEDVASYFYAAAVAARHLENGDQP